jgi:RNA polymerase sigma factor (sigma-70 family)
VPNYQLKKVREIRDAESSLRRKLGRRPEREEISKRLSKSVNKIDQTLQLRLREVSLDDKVGRERDTTISDYLVDRNCTSPEDDLIQREASSLVTEALTHLTDQEKTVVTFRFGLAGGTPLTLKEIGEQMGISRERVRQIECQAKTRLRKMFARKRMIKSPPKRPYPVSRVAKRTRFSH